MENTTQIPAGYMKDAAGRLVPESIVKPAEKLEDQLVAKIMDFARALSDQISRFKGWRSICVKDHPSIVSSTKTDDKNKVLRSGLCSFKGRRWPSYSFLQ